MGGRCFRALEHGTIEPDKLEAGCFRHVIDDSLVIRLAIAMNACEKTDLHDAGSG